MREFGQQVVMHACSEKLAVFGGRDGRERQHCDNAWTLLASLLRSFGAALLSGGLGNGFVARRVE